MDNNVVNTTQVGGSHYKHTTYQHWDFVYRALEGRYLEGNITKYLVRWRKKNGLQDLEKARHYLNKLIEEFNIGNVTPIANYYRIGMAPNQTPEHFCDVNGVDTAERMIILALASWRNRQNLNHIGGMLDALIETVVRTDEDERTRNGHGTKEDDGRALISYELMPCEPTEEMKSSVSNIVSGYAAEKIWKQMYTTALFIGEAGRGYVDQD